MPRPMWGVLGLLWLGASPAHSQQPETLAVRAADGLVLRATFYSAGGRAPLVLMFHQCNRKGPETGYEQLGARLAAAGVSAVAMDTRGFGGSTNAEYPDFRSDPDRSEAHWVRDVDALLAHLFQRRDLDTTRIAAIGASCGVDQSVHLAARRSAVRALVALSGSLGADAERAFARLRPMPVFVAFADGDKYDTPGSMRRLFGAVRDPRSRMLTYKGSLHGTPLLQDDPALEALLVEWLLTALKG